MVEQLAKHSAAEQAAEEIASEVTAAGNAAVFYRLKLERLWEISSELESVRGGYQQAAIRSRRK
jgi:hypothetical protein